MELTLVGVVMMLLEILVVPLCLGQCHFGCFQDYSFGQVLNLVGKVRSDEFGCIIVNVYAPNDDAWMN